MKAKYEKKIDNFVQSLGLSQGTPAMAHIIEQINETDAKIKKLDNKINEYIELVNATSASEQDFELLSEMLSNTAKCLNNMTVEQKRTAFRSIINKIVWDGENVHIYFFGEKDSDIDLSDEPPPRAVTIGLQMKF